MSEFHRQTAKVKQIAVFAFSVYLFIKAESIDSLRFGYKAIFFLLNRLLV